MKVYLTEWQRHFGWSMLAAGLQQALEASSASKEGGCRIHAIANLGLLSEPFLPFVYESRHSRIRCSPETAFSSGGSKDSTILGRRTGGCCLKCWRDHCAGGDGFSAPSALGKDGGRARPANQGSRCSMPASPGGTKKPKELLQTLAAPAGLTTQSADFPVEGPSFQQPSAEPRRESRQHATARGAGLSSPGPKLVESWPAQLGLSQRKEQKGGGSFAIASDRLKLAKTLAKNFGCQGGVPEDLKIFTH